MDKTALATLKNLLDVMEDDIFNRGMTTSYRTVREWMKNTEQHFPITSVARADLEEAGFDASKVDDATMERLANDLAEAYVPDKFWVDLEEAADDRGIPRKAD